MAENLRAVEVGVQIQDYERMSVILSVHIYAWALWLGWNLDLEGAVPLRREGVKVEVRSDVI